MTDRAGRSIAITCGIIVTVAIGTAAFAFRERIREEYWLWRLEKGDDAAQVLAVRKLGEMRSFRAVPKMLEFSFQSELVKEVEAVLSTLEPEVTPLLIELSENRELSASTTRMAANSMIIRMDVSRHMAKAEARGKASPPPPSF